MAQTRSIYDNFWTSSHIAILTLDLPEQMFHMALLLIKENSFAKLFWNPCINVEEMAQISSIYDYFIIWLSSVTLTLDLLEQCFSWHLYSSREQLCQNISKYIHKYRSNMQTSLFMEVLLLTFKCDLYFQHNWINVSHDTCTHQ